jgi:hypothetical protein
VVQRKPTQAEPASQDSSTAPVPAQGKAPAQQSG